MQNFEGLCQIASPVEVGSWSSTSQGGTLKDLVSMPLQRGQRLVKYKFTSYKYEDTRSPGQSEVNVKISSETVCGPVLHRSNFPVLLSDQQSSSK